MSLFWCFFEGEELPSSEGSLRHSKSVAELTGTADPRATSHCLGWGGDTGSHLSVLSNHFVGGEIQFSVHLPPEWKGEARPERHCHIPRGPLCSHCHSLRTLTTVCTCASAVSEQAGWRLHPFTDGLAALPVHPSSWSRLCLVLRSP